MFKIQPTTIIIGVIGLVISFAVITVCIISLKESKVWFRKKFGELKSFLRKLKVKYGVLWNIFNKLKGNELSYSVDVVFQLFVKFYKNNKHEMAQWAFNLEHFPNGRRDVSDMYRWIVKIRNDNYQEFKNIIREEEHISYWGTIYKRFNAYVNKKGELIIKPSDEDKPFIFENKILNLQNLLYNLDTSRCTWIIERRKYFGF